jgi:hypothetical protein
MSFLPLFSLCFKPQGLEPLVPELLEEVAQITEALRAGPVEPAGTVAAFAQERRLAQHTQVLRDRRPRDVGEVRGDCSGRKLVVAHEPKDLAPAWLGDGLEGILHFTVM